ncbi:hypothetical protein CCR94_08240 [Rhodoblastus sphagnicola]|uniref:Uncharacterized protein n=1 Tax=Rhodoblastus sphagnicola TaxID=333368 RepID=A0A2S6NAU0_9HYPH|nr:hypothetical protein [Rhodoblastus sphagnicola]MBB4201165.1 hypothetical protein [Rhodoblastus sphagnicola]PPQ31717.1 hypothetical protein CCR94_08240 [Rhodoblastus sphagnicola]
MFQDENKLGDPTDEEMSAYAAGESTGAVLGCKAVLQALIQTLAQHEADSTRFRASIKNLAYSIVVKTSVEDDEMFRAGRKTAAIDTINELLQLPPYA